MKCVITVDTTMTTFAVNVIPERACLDVAAWFENQDSVMANGTIDY